MWQQIIVIAIGGSLGATSRFLTTHYINHWLGSTFPFGTLMVNILGSFMIGFLIILFTEKLELSPLWRMALVIGFLGAFTTFSSFSLDTIKLIQQSQLILAMANILLNVIGSITATFLGIFLAKQLI